MAYHDRHRTDDPEPTVFEDTQLLDDLIVGYCEIFDGENPDPDVRIYDAHDCAHGQASEDCEFCDLIGGW